MLVDAGYGGTGGGVPLGSRMSAAVANAPWATWAGAGLSAALLAGIAVWAVDLVTRDVREVPVVAAMDGPMRLAPETPGGVETPHQGLAIGEIVSGGAATAAPDTVTLAPPPDVFDAPTMSEREAALAAMEETPAPDTMVADPAPETSADDLFADAVNAAVLQAVAAEPGIIVSPRPQRRPTGLRRGAAKALAVVEPTALTAGTRLAQLATLDSRAQAETEWRRLQRRHPAFLADREPVIQQAAAGDRTFWRLRASGFADGDEARRLCTALSAEGTACIPVTHR